MGSSKKTVLDLTPDQQVTFGKVVFWAMDEYQRPYDEAYRMVLESWGLDCFHPPPQRKWLKPGAYECLVCKSYVVER